MKNVLITGANRGIGRSLCQRFKDEGFNVFAACRKSSPELEKMGVNIIAGIDVARADTLSTLKEALSGTSLDVLVNNAGILRDECLGDLDFDSISEQFEVNALGPLRVCETVLENLTADAKIAFITSRMGSIEDNTSGGRYGYRMSKCALNAAAVSVAHDLKGKGVAVAILHPGLVGTDMIGGVGNVTPDEAAQQLFERIDELTLATSGTFWHANGDTLPW